MRVPLVAPVDLTGTAAASLALIAAIFAPGMAVVSLLRLGRDALERFVLSVAIGRLLFAAVTLIATGTIGRSLLIGWAVAGGATGIALLARRRRAPDAVGRSPGAAPWTLIVPVAVAITAALLLVHAVVARSGLVNAAGEIVFYGRDTTNDPLVYASMALRLALEGLPLSIPFAGGAPGPAPYASYAVLAGLHLLAQTSILDLAFRIVPAFDAITMTLSGVALTRALGGGPLAASLGGALLALGSEASFLVPPAAAVLGVHVQPLDSWALFGPYLAAFNPITPALQTLFAACVLVSQLRAGARATAIVAGLLVAGLFELKLFLWAPAVTGLVGAALLRPPRSVAASLRLAAGFGILGSMPSIVDRLLWVRAHAGQDETAFQICIGCLPRYLADVAWGSHDSSFALFRDFRAADLLVPHVLLSTLGSVLLVGAVAIGARALALPALWRGARCDDARAAVLRFLGAGALVGLGAAVTLVTTPHYLNGAQFAWIACFGLWPLVGIELERLTAARRFPLVAVALCLALLSTADVFERLGYGAPVWQRVKPGERELLVQLPGVSESDDVVLEPSMVQDPDRASPVPWLTSRPVHLTLLSAVQSLPEAERNRRFDQLLAVFSGDDRDAAVQAITASGARWVYVPLGWRLRFEAPALLEPVLTSPAGTIYRVHPEAGSTKP